MLLYMMKIELFRNAVNFYWIGSKSIKLGNTVLLL